MTSETHFGLLLIDDFALMSYASFIEPFRAANVLAGAPLYRWSHLSPGAGEAVASNGARLVADMRVGEPFEGDMLFVFAAGDPARFDDAACLSWLRMLARHGLRIGGISGGPFVLARAGLLAGRRATIHWEHAAALRDEFPGLMLEDSLFVIDGDRMTCAGGTASLDLALTLIDADHGSLLAQRVGDWFLRALSRRADHRQRAALADRHGTTNVRLLSMLEAMESDMEEPISRSALADRAGISLRQLERLSTRHLGRSVAEAYLAIRLDRAAELLRSTGQPVTQVALACGFRTPAHFSRRFRQRFGESPTWMRRQDD